MAYRNVCSFLGHLGRDIETKVFQDGTKVGNTGLAITKKWKGKDGKVVEKTTWLNLKFPNHMVDTAVKYATKGKMILVDGELEVREYEKDGQKGTALDLRVTSYQLLDKKPAETNGASAQEQEDFTYPEDPEHPEA